jgi:alkaline phosphatase
MFFNTEATIIALGYLGIFLMMITNGIATTPSSQILYIICGYFISIGNLSWALVIFVGALGNTIGNIILYELVRGKGIDYILKWKIFPEKEIKKISHALNKKGVWFLFFGKLLPALKVFVPIAAGIAKTDRRIYIPLMTVASIIWTLPFLTIGYYFGKSSNIFGKYSVFLVIIAVAVMGLFYKYINSEKVIEEIED